MTEVSLECASRDPNVNTKFVGASILTRVGMVAHWDIVTPISQQARNLGTTQGSWFIQNGTPTHSSWPADPPRNHQGGAQPASAQRSPTPQPSNQPKGTKRLAQEWRNKQATAKAGTVAATESPQTTGTSKPNATTRKLKRHKGHAIMEGEELAKIQKLAITAEAERPPHQDAGRPTTEIASVALEEPARTQKTTAAVATERPARVPHLELH